MRGFILTVLILVGFLFIFLLMAIEDDKRWFQEFANSTERTDLSQIERMTADTLVYRFSKLQGKTVEVEGYLNFEFEDVSICTEKTENILENSMLSRGKCFSLRIYVDPRDSKDTLALKLRSHVGQKVIIRGIVDTVVFERGDYLATLVFERCVDF